MANNRFGLHYACILIFIWNCCALDDFQTDIPMINAVLTELQELICFMKDLFFMATGTPNALFVFLMLTFSTDFFSNH